MCENEGAHFCIIDVNGTTVEAARQRPNGLRDLLSLLELEEDDLQIILAPLTSVLICDLDTQKISFRHASLPDFLRDEKRSEKYCIRALPTHLSILLLNQIASGKFAEVDDGEAPINCQIFENLTMPIDKHNVDLPELLENADITVDLYASLSAYEPCQQDSAFTLSFYASRLLNSIKITVRVTSEWCTTIGIAHSSGCVGFRG